ncbi:pseudaminic acid synthase [Ferrovibrio terrae]|uniref:pseudaminic acid synthase n=1 Tax=Ferrovibrio terrae TaxID=2594003 RepID=UPI0031379F23
MANREVSIGGRKIGLAHPPYVIAEMSGNHNGNLDRALKLIDAAKAAGADAVKLQTYTADTITLNHKSPDFLIEGGLWDGRYLYELYEEAHTPWSWHKTLFDHARGLDLPIFSSPFDFTAVDFLAELGVPAYKIASFEAIDLPLVEKAAQTGRPLIISTGLADLGEVEDAVTVARNAGNDELIVLHCVSGYPTPMEDCNLACITHLAETFDVITGFSDHTLGVHAAIAATALGACVIEKHLTLSRADGGPDAAFSLEPADMAVLIAGCREAWAARGRIDYSQKGSEKANAKFRRSLYAVVDIAAGEILTPQNIRSIRPGYGLAPRYLPEVMGRRAGSFIARGTPLSWPLIGDEQA